MPPLNSQSDQESHSLKEVNVKNPSENQELSPFWSIIDDIDQGVEVNLSIVWRIDLIINFFGGTSEVRLGSKQALIDAALGSTETRLNL